MTLLTPFRFVFFRFKERFAPKNPGLYSYTSYDEYKQIQIDGNIKKLDRVWASEANIKQLSDYLKQHLPEIRFGICHGTRRGKEQEWFSKYTGAHVIGTEISPTATQFPHTIEWDFHNVKDEWIGATDFIYSNSFDHSYKPAECLDAWMSCLKPHGVCIIEWSNGHVDHNQLDPFGGTWDDYLGLINRKYRLQAVVKATDNWWYKNKRAYFFIIAHRPATQPMVHA